MYYSVYTSFSAITPGFHGPERPELCFRKCMKVDKSPSEATYHGRRRVLVKSERKLNPGT